MEFFLLPLGLGFLAAPVIAIVAVILNVRLRGRVEAVEREIAWVRRNMIRPGAPPRETEPVAAPQGSEPVAAQEIPPQARPAVPPPRVSPVAPPVLPAAAPPPPPARGRPIEEVIGMRWLNIAGIITLLFGVAFFLKYAYENAWIGPRGRVAIGVLSGLAAIAIGETSRRRGHRIFAQGLCGGGIAALYLSFFFSFRLYRLIEIAPAFALMAAVTACGFALAVLQDSPAVALLSLLGGYLTPVLLSTGQDAAEFLFSYLALLALGALGVTYFRRWRALDLLAFAGTCALYGGWHASFYSRDRLGVALVGLVTFFCVFLFVPYGHALLRRAASQANDHVLSIANAAFTFGYLYRMIHPLSPRALGFIALALSGVYLGLGSLARRRLPEDRGLAISVLGISVAFLTLAVPLELGLHGITLAWATQGLVIIFFGFRYESRLTRLAGLAVMALAVVRLFARHLPLHTLPFALVFNAPFGTWLFVACAIFAAGWLYRWEAEGLDPDEARLVHGLPIAAVLLLFVALNLESRLYCDLWFMSEDALAGLTMLLWAVFPPALLVLGRAMRDRAMAGAANALTFLSVIPLFMLLERVSAVSETLFGSFVFWMGALGVASFFAAAAWDRRFVRLDLGEVRLHQLLTAAGAALLLILLTTELYSHFRLEPGAAEETAKNGLRALLSVSVLWAVYASILMVIGFGRSDRACRYGASALYLVTLSKVFLVDVWELREVYRIVSFVSLGLLLVVASFLYSRYRSRIAAVVLAGALGLLGGREARADFGPAAWEFVRSIEVAPAAEGGTTFAAAVLDEAVIDAARYDLADLRVIGRDRAEVPYVIRARTEGKALETYAPRLLNRGRHGDRSVSVELDFAAKVTKNLLEVKSTGENFRRRVRVEGSDDARAWVTLVENAWVYRVPPAAAAGRQAADSNGAAPAGGPAAAGGARFEEVRIADNDFRRLRITVFPMPDEKEPIDVLEIRAQRETIREPETAPINVVSLKATEDPKTKTSAFEIDLGYRHARAAIVDFDFADEAFQRSYRLQSRDAETIRLPGGLTETGQIATATLPAPWRPAAYGTFYRVPAGRAREKAIDETRITLNDTEARYLRLVVADQDNRPLRLRSVRVQGLVQRIIFPVRPGGAYSLYYGNPRAAPPAYDLPALLPDLDAHPASQAALGRQRPNPLRAGAPAPPWSERHPWALWVVLLAGVSGLAFLVLRTARGLSGARPAG